MSAIGKKVDVVARRYISPSVQEVRKGIGEVGITVVSGIGYVCFGLQLSFSVLISENCLANPILILIEQC